MEKLNNHFTYVKNRIFLKYLKYCKLKHSNIPQINCIILLEMIKKKNCDEVELVLGVDTF